jgi:hypothetical protein
MAIAPKRPEIYQGTRIPSPIPSVLEVREDLRTSEDVLTVNFGPNHPSTHGVLRLVVDLHGEEVVGLAAVVGYLHTGFEKSMEQKSWWKATTRRASTTCRSEQRARVRPGIEAVDISACTCDLDADAARGAEQDPLASRVARDSRARARAISMFWYCFASATASSISLSSSPASGCTRVTSRSAAWPRMCRRGSGRIAVFVE